MTSSHAITYLGLSWAPWQCNGIAMLLIRKGHDRLSQPELNLEPQAILNVILLSCSKTYSNWIVDTWFPVIDTICDTWPMYVHINLTWLLNCIHISHVSLFLWENVLETLENILKPTHLTPSLTFREQVHVSMFQYISVKSTLYLLASICTSTIQHVLLKIH